MGRYSLSEAVQKLFPGLVVSHYKELRNVLNKLMDHGIIVRDPNLEGHDKSRNVREEAFSAIHNVTLLHALFPQTNKLKDIFSNPKVRPMYAEAAQHIIALPFFDDVGINTNRDAFLEMLNSDDSFVENELPNLFTVLPQVVFGGKHSTLVEVGLKCHTRSSEYKMLEAFLAKDIEKAYQVAVENSFNSKEAVALQGLVISKYEGAIRAQNFLRKFI